MTKGEWPWPLEKKFLRGPTLQFITKLVYRLDGKLLIEMGSRSEFHCVYI